MAKSKNTAAAYAALERELAEARAYQARHRLMRRQRGAGHALSR